MPITRRTFLKTTAAGAAAATLPAASWGQIRGSNEDIRVGVVGFRSRGGSHINGFHRLDGVRVVALCDVDSKVLDKGAAQFTKRNEKVDTYVDYRRMLEDESLDVIAIATPNHLHSLQAIWACQAGKDVYVEKPVSHNVYEGRKLVEASRRHDRIVQCGTQSRSNRGMRELMEYVHSGELGAIKYVRGLCYKPRGSIGKVKGPQRVPDHIDYDLWTGPAPLQPLMRKRLHYDWHWVWPTGNGDLGNQGIHQMDLARWALQENALAPRTVSLGGRVGYDDDGTTPNTMIVGHFYEKAPLYFEVRGLPRKKGDKKMDEHRGARIGVIVQCENGYVSIPAYNGGTVFDESGTKVKVFSGGGNHFANFIGAVRSRKRDELSAEIQEGHLSSALCHVGNISVLTGEPLPWAEIKKDGEIAGCFGPDLDRIESHLVANGLDAGKASLSRGLELTVDPETERFPDGHPALPLLTREYRKPFVVPDSV